MTLADADPPKPMPPVESPATPMLSTGPTLEQPVKSGWSTQKSFALAALGGGVVGVGVGTAFGVVGKLKNDQALEPQNCRTSSYCTQTGLSLTDDAKHAATASTIAFSVGGGLLVVGAVLWFTAPSGSTATVGVRAAPVVEQRYQGVAIDAVW